MEAIISIGTMNQELESSLIILKEQGITDFLNYGLKKGEIRTLKEGMDTLEQVFIPHLEDEERYEDCAWLKAEIKQLKQNTVWE